MYLHDYKTTHSEMCYPSHGCLVPAVGPGWAGLVSEMMDELDAARRYQKESLWVEDIREEGGALDVLVSWCTPEIQAIIDRYTDRSVLVCKNCGSEGNRPRGGIHAARGLCWACLKMN